jgi:hypothetical protein
MWMDFVGFDEDPGIRVKLRGSFLIKDSCGRIKERRCMIADAHGMPMSGASAHLIVNSWTAANAFRRSLALNLTRTPSGHERQVQPVSSGNTPESQDCASDSRV